MEEHSGLLEMRENCASPREWCGILLALEWWGKGCKRGLGAALVQFEGVQQEHTSAHAWCFLTLVLLFFCWKLLMLFWF